LSLVLDSSATLAWIFPDETTAAIRELLAKVTAFGAAVPSVWRLEVANGLTVAMRRGRVDAAFRDGAFADLALLNIETDPLSDGHVWTTTVRLADRFRLTLYDASYLELALRRGLPLATLDAPLRAAATSSGVPLLGAA
jgi:predicted nucleic acid-binding protein